MEKLAGRSAGTSLQGAHQSHTFISSKSNCCAWDALLDGQNLIVYTFAWIYLDMFLVVVFFLFFFCFVQCKRTYMYILQS